MKTNVGIKVVSTPFQKELYHSSPKKMVEKEDDEKQDEDKKRPNSLEKLSKQNHEKHTGVQFTLVSDRVEKTYNQTLHFISFHSEAINLAVFWALNHCVEGTTVYNLGCGEGEFFDRLVRTFRNEYNGYKYSATGLSLVGVDKSKDRIKLCHENLDWVQNSQRVQIYCADANTFPIKNASFILMRYSIQTIHNVEQRQKMLQSISKGLRRGGVLFLNEKIQIKSNQMVKTSRRLNKEHSRQQDIKSRLKRKTSQATLYTEKDLINFLHSVGFDSVEIVFKWNDFIAVVAIKKHFNMKHRGKEKTTYSPLDVMFEKGANYIRDKLDPKDYASLQLKRYKFFGEKTTFESRKRREYEKVAKFIQKIPILQSQINTVNDNSLSIGNSDTLTMTQLMTLNYCTKQLQPWKQCSMQLFGIDLEREMIDNRHWKKISAQLPSLREKKICDMGCGNGFFLFHLLQHKPKLMIGIDKDLNAFLQFTLLQRIASIKNIYFELLRKDDIRFFPNIFDVVFCRGILHRCRNPHYTLCNINSSMKSGSYLIVDCLGMEGDKVSRLRKRSVHNFPSLNMILEWLEWAKFINAKVIFKEELTSTDKINGYTKKGISLHRFCVLAEKEDISSDSDSCG